MRIYYTTEFGGPKSIFNDLIRNLQLIKYQLMWELRHLENEINAEKEGRIIIVISEGFSGCRIEHFSEELSKKILKICTKFGACKVK